MEVENKKNMDRMFGIELNHSLGMGEWYITRVPGGWIYREWDCEKDQPCEVGTYVPEPPVLFDSIVGQIGNYTGEEL